jgi:hypothetical protein
MVGHAQLFCTWPILSQPKSAKHQQTAKFFQQYLGHLKGNYDLNSSFENADRLLEQKRTGRVHYIEPINKIIKPTCVGFY